MVNMHKETMGNQHFFTHNFLIAGDRKQVFKENQDWFGNNVWHIISLNCIKR